MEVDDAAGAHGGDGELGGAGVRRPPEPLHGREGLAERGRVLGDQPREAVPHAVDHRRDLLGAEADEDAQGVRAGPLRDRVGEERREGEPLQDPLERGGVRRDVQEAVEVQPRLRVGRAGLQEQLVRWLVRGVGPEEAERVRQRESVDGLGALGLEPFEHLADV